MNPEPGDIIESDTTIAPSEALGTNPVLMNSGQEVPTPLRYYSVSVAANKPTSNLNPGDLCYAQDTQELFIAISPTTWHEIAHS
jgi:hypothetical protein